MGSFQAVPGQSACREARLVVVNLLDSDGLITYHHINIYQQYTYTSIISMMIYIYMIYIYGIYIYIGIYIYWIYIYVYDMCIYIYG